MGEIKPFTQAIILAGGRGERLRPFTDNLPKPMVPVNGKPFLEYVVELLRENGITEIVMLLGYLPEKITEYFGDGKKFGVSIKYSIGSVDDLPERAFGTPRRFSRTNFFSSTAIITGLLILKN